MALLINSGHFYRNIAFSGSPTANGGEGTVNAAHAVKPLVLVAIKNIMNHLPVTPALKNKVADKAILAGLDPDDPKYNFMPFGWMVNGFSFHEDYAQNFPHLILIFLCLLTFFLRKKLYNSPPNVYLLFILSLLATSLLFSVNAEMAAMVESFANTIVYALFGFYWNGDGTFFESNGGHFTYTSNYLWFWHPYL